MALINDTIDVKVLIQSLNEAGIRVRSEFGSLTPTQLNWKPSAKGWSVAQCLDHLVISNSTYWPTFDRIARGDYRMTGWERWSPLSGIIGRAFVKEMKANVTRKLKTAQIFLPASSDVEAFIVDRFQKNLDDLSGYFMRFENVDDKLIISSPVTGFVTYSLVHVMMFLSTHQHRHVNQGIRVKQTSGFPKVN